MILKAEVVIKMMIRHLWKSGQPRGHSWWSVTRRGEIGRDLIRMARKGKSRRRYGRGGDRKGFRYSKMRNRRGSLQLLPRELKLVLFDLNCIIIF